MSEKMSNKAAGFYFAAAAAMIAVVSVIRYLMWAPAHKSMDIVVAAALILGIVIDIVLIVKDNDYLTVIATACYSVAAVKMLTDSVGSFVDAFQGINMFGDATQVSIILSIFAVMAVSILLSIIASFLRRVKG